MLSLAFLIAALVLAILAAVNVPSAPRFSLFPAAFACFIIHLLVGKF